MVFKRGYKHIVTAASATGAVLLVAGIILNAGALHRQLNAWQLLPQPERLTELYFTDHSHLPTSYTPGASQIVAFTTHNLEYRGMTYYYVIMQSSADGKQSQQLSSGSFSLADTKTKQLSVPVTVADLGARSKISVQLSTNETIDYYVSEVQA